MIFNTVIESVTIKLDELLNLISIKEILISDKPEITIVRHGNETGINVFILNQTYKYLSDLGYALYYKHVNMNRRLSVEEFSRAPKNHLDYVLRHDG